MRRYKAVILGGSGFAGAELVRRLLVHPEIELIRVCALDHVGEPLSAAHPHLEGLTTLRFENPTPEAAVSDADVVLMGLPHDASVRVVEAVMDRDVRVIDMSGAFRLRRPEPYRRYYGHDHPRPEWLERFVYGLPELNRAALRGARYVASPGCFATAVELALLPLARAGWLGSQVDVVGITGSSGSGVTPSPTTHHPTRSVNLRTYRPLDHQHTPEIEDVLTELQRSPVKLNFVPISAPLSRGIFVSAFARVPESLGEAPIAEAFAEAYRSERFVRIPARRLPEVVAVAGSNYAEVGYSLGAVEDGRRLVTVFAALDNLMKGGAGQAIQNLNLMLELDESLTLTDPGGYP